MHRNQRSSSSANRPLPALAAATSIAFALAALAGCGGSPRQAAKSAPTPEETAYLQNIQVTPGQAESAQNFLQHTVTTVHGTVANHGNKAVLYLEISLTFSDIEGKPIEQRTDAPISGGTPPLKPGEARAFQVSFDQVPAVWNQAPPQMVPKRVILAGE
ncbi:MAG TPA: FxLYD domain-containing protein [Terriglobia bacterium]|nr:FxLYD domain-containing protein [Terriglobia bacterium]